MLSRRELLALTAAAGLLRCASPIAERKGDPDSPAARGRLEARPGTITTPGMKGRLRRGRSLLYIPAAVDPNRAAPLILTLHGAGGGAREMLEAMKDEAARIGAILVAPQSLRTSWDIIRGELGPDVEQIDDLLEHVFASYTIDTKHIAVSGFSDGASYALTLGIANGDLFTHVIAFSPGFMAGRTQVGAPRFFISHGTTDRILPIESGGRRIARELKAANHNVTFREFDGGHFLPKDVVTEGVDWFLA